MMRMTKTLMIAAALAAAASPVLAADPIVEQALSAGTIGEQWDGYIGFVSAPSGELKSAVDAINIKRRAGYTQIAAARNVTVDQFAQTTACSTLRAVKPGQAYKLKDGGWQRRSGAESITPDYCG